MKTKKTFNVVMLPTEKASSLFIDTRTNELVKSMNIPPAGSIWPNQHLYIISDDEIKEGDWSICKDNPPVQTTISNMKFICNDCKKIVATTDTLSFTNEKHELGNVTDYLPQLPESFIQAYIKAYNEGKPIIEVDLEVEIGNWEHHDNVHKRCVNCNTINHKLDEYNCVCTKNVKTRSDNTVIVHQSKMYTREEVIAFAKKYAARCQAPIQSTKWIDENL